MASIDSFSSRTNRSGGGVSERFNIKDISIRHKLTLIMLLVSSVVLLLSSIAFMINDLLTLQHRMDNDLKVQTEIMAYHLASAVEFEDRDFSQKTLNAVGLKDSIVMAQVYRGNLPQEQRLYATFPETKIPSQLPVLIGDYLLHKLFSSTAYLQYSLSLINPNNDIVGHVVLLMKRDELYERIFSYAMIAFIIILVSVIVALLLSQQLQQVITRPILHLAQMTRQVSVAKDYSLRVEPLSSDELGVLYNGFNEMLQAIQERDQKLEHHREQLERTVSTRTAELKKLNLKLTYQAYHDALTNLPNRALFIKRVEQAIEQSGRQGEMMAMLFIDLDRFKYINDTLGHAAGDRLLQEVSKRLLSCTRQPEDTIARLGGDEFTILLRDIREPTNAGIVAEHIIKVLTSPLHFNQQELYITPSIGISIYPKDGHDVGALMKNADAGMYMAKKQGRNSYRFYTSSANAMNAARLNMENKLRQALEYNEFEVWYQPRFDLRSGIVTGAEALIRWRSPEFDLVPPAQFIPLAEDTGLIIPIGEWVLRTACEENLHWVSEGFSNLHVSVNLSARQFVQEDLLSNIEHLIEELQMDPHSLELELTESLIMPNAEDTIETLRGLKRLGIYISIDDFGTGYSSLSYLKRFPIDTLKIDQSFVRDINMDKDGGALVTAIIAMSHNLNLNVVAEGVETVEQLHFLNAYHCDYVQGYLFGKPMPSDDFLNLLKHPVDMDALLAK